MTSQETRKANAEKFVDKLKALATDAARGERAALRRYWSEGTRSYALPVLGRFFAIGDPTRTIIAALFAVHPAHGSSGSLGKSCRDLARGDLKNFETRFRRLLASETIGDLADQTYRIVKRCERDGIPVNYVSLFLDLDSWHFRSEDIKTRWARDFWQAADPSEAEAQPFVAP